MTPRVELFQFRYRDPLTGKWTRARYSAMRQEIAARYAEYEIIGPSATRDVDPAARPFTPHTFALQRDREPAVELQPAIDATEAHLLAVFLRRYITYCARRRQFAAMNGAARLFVELSRGYQSAKPERLTP